MDLPPEDPALPPNLVDSATFRAAMRMVPGAVAVITTSLDGVSVGLTVTAVCSVSADPPQLLACINRSSSGHPAIAAAGRFGVSFLAHHHQRVADVFSSPVDDRFAHAEWVELGSGVPLLRDAVAAFDCVVMQMVQAGTHTIFIGAVVGALVQDVPNLVYKQGAYSAL
jgi:flavin reductase (DIM6/NTAB) family NADH-FMN oxidoreductase RutF